MTDNKVEKTYNSSKPKPESVEKQVNIHNLNQQIKNNNTPKDAS